MYQVRWFRAKTKIELKTGRKTHPVIPVGTELLVGDDGIADGYYISIPDLKTPVGFYDKADFEILSLKTVKITGLKKKRKSEK